jgi:hypothetical protein
MTNHEEQSGQAEVLPFAIMWRNPQAFVQGQLTLRETSHLYYGWAEQARRIRARRAHWDANNSCPLQAHGCVFAWDPRPHCGGALEPSGQSAVGALGLPGEPSFSNTTLSGW